MTVAFNMLGQVCDNMLLSTMMRRRAEERKALKYGSELPMQRIPASRATNMPCSCSNPFVNGR